MNLRILQYNIAACRNYEEPGEKIKIDRVIDTLKSFNADIITLNEVDLNVPRSGNIDQAKILGESLGYHYSFAPAIDLDGGKYGIAILSRFPIITAEIKKIQDPEVIDKNEPYESRVFLISTIDIGNPIKVITSHFGLMPTEQVNAVNMAIREIKNSKIPTILCGDFNMTSDNFLIKKLSAEISDTVKAATEEVVTFWANGLHGEHQGSKIDYIFATDEFTVKKIINPKINVSDHRPYICDMEF